VVLIKELQKIGVFQKAPSLKRGAVRRRRGIPPKTSNFGIPGTSCATPFTRLCR